MVLTNLLFTFFEGASVSAAPAPGGVVTTTQITTGSRRIVVHRTNDNTTAGEINSVVVDKSTLAGPDGSEPGRLVIERIQWNIFGQGTIALSFDHTADNIAAVLSGGGDRRYPDAGVVDLASPGDTGDLLISAPPSLGGSYDITLTLRLKD